MNVTPLDLRQQKFKSAMRGYERGEVDALAERGGRRLRRRLARGRPPAQPSVARLETALAEHKSEGEEPEATPWSGRAQRGWLTSCARRPNADAQRVLHEAESRADMLIQKAQVRLEDLQREIEGLRFAAPRDPKRRSKPIINALQEHPRLSCGEQDAREERDDKIPPDAPAPAAEEPAPPSRRPPPRSEGPSVRRTASRAMVREGLPGGAVVEVRVIPRAATECDGWGR